ncbi:MAG: acetoacetate decarboxylase family protein [bacterium]|nr:acetoacetate decarboxylase family protein [bacterium]
MDSRCRWEAKPPWSGGRATWGEPKKIADCSIERVGDGVGATIVRGGIAYAELRGRVVETLPVPPPCETLDFYFKFMILPDDKGFDQDPVLVHCRRTYDVSPWERVEGEVILRDSAIDPIVDIRVRRLVRLHYVEFESVQVARSSIASRATGSLPSCISGTAISSGIVERGPKS